MRVVLTLLLVTAFGSAGVSHAVVAQVAPSASAVAGSWAGWMDVAGNFQPFMASFTPGNTPPGKITNLLFGISRPLSALTVDGARVKVEPSDPRAPVLSGTLEGDKITGTAEARGGRTGTFRLIRTADLTTAALARFIGAYRFTDGRLVLIDSVPETGSVQIYAVDPITGQVRGMYPTSATEFISGPALLVPEPTEHSLSFDVTGDRIAGVVRRSTDGLPERASRVEIRQEDVRFRNGDVILAGTLLLPPTAGRHPALVFMHGGGPARREWFWGFGFLMAARGFTVLAFDKRGSGMSTGDWRGSSFEELADDGVAAAKFLEQRPEVDKGHIGFWGLSQGAWTAPLAALRFPRAAFVMTLSGGGLSPAEAEIFDSEYEMRKARYGEEDIRDAMAFQTAKNQYWRTGSGWTEYIERRNQIRSKPWFPLPGTDLFGPETPEDPYWSRDRRFYFYDPVPTLRALRAPILAIFGELDSPEGVKANVAGLTNSLRAGGNRDVAVKVFPNARHNLMDLSGFGPSDYPRLQRFAPGLFETMASWLAQRVKR